MAFEIGTSTTIADFFTNLATFAATNAGFTNEGTFTIGARTGYSLSKGGVYWNFLPGASDTFLTATRYYTTARMTYSKPTSTFDTTTPVGQYRFTHFTTYSTETGFISHAFYTQGNAVHAVLEISQNVFTHISFGSITKEGTWTGGEYLTANDTGFNTSPLGHRIETSQGNAVFANIADTAPSSGDSVGFIRYQQTGNSSDDFSPAISVGSAINNQGSFFSGTYDTSSTGSWNVNRGAYYNLLFHGFSTYNLRAPLLPIFCMLRNQSTISFPDRYFIAGVIEGVRQVNGTNLDAKELVDTNWQVYPVGQKTGSVAVGPVTNGFYYAYERVA